MQNPNYLKQLARDKRVTAAARLAGHYSGIAIAFLLVVGALMAIAAFGWFLLTGHPIQTVGQVLGLLLVCGVSYGLCEVFRDRS